MSPNETGSESRRQVTCIPRCPEREWINTAELTCEEFGFLQRLRDFSLARGGIEDSEDLLQRLSKTFQLSKYKLKKLWPVLENFFTLRDGFYVYEPDEQQRSQVININTKRRVAGSLGAKVRWSKRLEEFPKLNSDADSKAIPENLGDGIALAASIDSVEQQQLLLKEKAAAAALDSTGTEEPSNLPESPPAKTQEKIFQVAARCRELDLQIPDRGLCARLCQRFPGIDPWLWPKFSGQVSPGLWLSKTADDMIGEASRQRDQERKKPQKAGMQRAAAVGDPYKLGD